MELKLRKFRYLLLDPEITYPILMKLLKRELTQAEKVRLNKEDYIMKNYVIYTVGGTFKIKANRIVYDDNVISFYVDSNMVAVLPIKGVYIVVEEEYELNQEY